VRGLIFHSERGSEYAGTALGDRLKALDVRQSMTRVIWAAGQALLAFWWTYVERGGALQDIGTSRGHAQTGTR
jgi:hypothetical protein